jgi:hypothetical protein
MPKLFAHYGAGHITLLYALAWTPWLLWAARKSIERAHFSGLQAIILALIFLADPRWALYAGILWFAYRLIALRSETRQFWRQLAAIVPQIILALALAAPLILPLAEFAQRSSRADMTAEDVLAFSLPPARLLGLVFPDFGGMHEWIVYFGGALLLLGLLALVWWRLRPGIIFWGWTALISLILSLGVHLPGMQLLANLPLLSLLRVPSRVLFIFGLALAVMGAHSLDLLLSPTPLEGVFVRRAGRLLTALTGFTLALSLGVWGMTGSLPLNFLWGSLALSAGAFWIALRASGRLSPAPWLIGLFALCLFDWGGVNRTLFTWRPVEQVFAEGRDVLDYLSDQTLNETSPQLFRVYSPSYSLPQQNTVDAGIQLAEGIDPLQLQSYVEFMEIASGVPRSGYSVTLPPFATGEPATDNAAYLPDAGLLGLLNVHYIAAEFDLDVKAFSYISRFNNTRLYRNMAALPRAWVQPENSAGIEDGWSEAQVSDWAPERILIQANGPGLLVLSEVAYPGWQVQVDGKSATLTSAYNLLRAVSLEPGTHQVSFIYRPLSLYVGLAACAGGLSLLLFLYWYSRYRARSASEVGG